jgi:Zn-dependent protease with chaperone function
VIELWQADLDELACRSHHWAVRRWPPKLVVKRGRFSPWWCPALWFALRPSAWTVLHCIVVSDALLTCPQPARLYLLAHELGHVEAMHPAQFALAVLFSAGGLVLLSLAVRGLLAIDLIYVAAVLFLTGCVLSARLIWLMQTLAVEFEADAIAVRLIGCQPVMDGIRWVASASGRGITEDRRARLVRLAELCQCRKDLVRQACEAA